MQERRFSIIGAGMGQTDGLLPAAREALCAADLALSTPRLAESLSGLRPVESCATGELAARAIESGAGHVAVLVSGDTGFFSLTRTLAAHLREHGAVECFCGVSSLQYFCAALGTSYDDAVWMSLHGRPGSPVGAVSYNKKVFFLTGGARRAPDLCRELAEAGLTHVRVSLGENLGQPDERIVTGSTEELAALGCADLAVLLVQNDAPADANRPLFDADMTRGSVPMTKQEVRWISANLLAPQPTDVIYDVGAGTGSVSIELARRAHRGTVYAVERGEEGLALIEQNRCALGAYNVRPVAGYAPEALHELPAPDAAFIGGSGGNLREILAVLKEKNPNVRVVLNAIALETLAEAQAALRALDFSDIEVCQIAAARGRKVGSHTLMTANNPVFILRAGGAS